MIIHKRFCDKRAFFLQSHISSNDAELGAIQENILAVSIFFSLISSVTSSCQLIDGTRERGCALYS